MGKVTGLAIAEGDNDLVFLTGDTVFFDGVRDAPTPSKAKTGRRVRWCRPHGGPFNLTLNTNDVLELPHVFPQAKVAVIHAEGWHHFTESFDDVKRAFETLGLGDKLVPLSVGAPSELAL